MCFYAKTTLLAIALLMGAGATNSFGQATELPDAVPSQSLVGHERSVLAEPIYEEPFLQEPNYEEPPFEVPVLQAPALKAPVQNAPSHQPLTVFEGQPIDHHDGYGIPVDQTAPIESYTYGLGSHEVTQPESGYLDASCGMEEIGCSVMPATACDCGPVCGCETNYEIPMGGVFQHGVGIPDVGQSLREVIGDTSQCDPCKGNDFKPGLLTWGNDFCVRNGFAVDSFLLSGCGYFSVDFGIGMTGDRARAVGTLANSIGGFPDYDLQEGSFGRYALGMGSGKHRVELELGFHRNTIDETKSGAGARSLDRFRADGYRRSTTFMFNGYRDFHNSTFWTPYLKGGVGISHNVSRATVDADINSAASIAALGLPGASQQRTEFPRSSTTKFAWSIGAGVATDLTERIKFDVEYQFLNAGDARTGVDGIGNAIEFGNGALHELAFGLRFYR